MYQLEIFRDRQLVATQPLRAGDLTIGRDPQCDIVLDDPLVSRHHACLHVRDGEFVIEDVSHKNGIVVRHRRVDRAVLQHGTTVRLGGHHLRLCLGGIGLPSTAGSTPPAVDGDRPTVVIASTDPMLTAAPPWSLREPCLSWTDRDGERVVVLRRGPQTLGPSRDADVVLPNAGPPSTPLASIDIRGKSIVLTRLGPRGSVLVNEKVVDERVLRDGDLLAVGDQVLSFHCRD